MIKTLLIFSDWRPAALWERFPRPLHRVELPFHSLEAGKAADGGGFVVDNVLLFIVEDEAG